MLRDYARRLITAAAHLLLVYCFLLGLSKEGLPEALHAFGGDDDAQIGRERERHVDRVSN